MSLNAVKVMLYANVILLMFRVLSTFSRWEHSAKYWRPTSLKINYVQFLLILNNFPYYFEYIIERILLNIHDYCLKFSKVLKSSYTTPLKCVAILSVDYRVLCYERTGSWKTIFTLKIKNKGVLIEVYDYCNSFDSINFSIHSSNTSFHNQNSTWN